MAPLLYMIPASPPARAVLLCAKALGLELELKQVNIGNREQFTPEYLEINPQHTVPALVDDDGFTVWDSHAIMAYLVGKYGKDKSLYPSDLKKRAAIDQRLHFDCSVLCAIGLRISRAIIYNDAKEVTPEQKRELKDAFDFTETFLENKTYIAGDELSIADFSYVSSITSWLYFISIEGSTYPIIQAWLKRMERLPYYAEANKPGLAGYYAGIQSRGITRA